MGEGASNERIVVQEADGPPRMIDPLLEQGALLLQLLEPCIPLLDLSEKFGFARVAH